MNAYCKKITSSNPKRIITKIESRCGKNWKGKARKSLNKKAMHLQPQTRLAMNLNLLLKISHSWPAQSLRFATLAGSSMMDE